MAPDAGRHPPEPRPWPRTRSAPPYATPDGTDVLRAYAAQADAHPTTVRWSHRRDIGRVRIVMVDSRAARVLDEGGRAIAEPAEQEWSEEQLLGARGGCDHLPVRTSPPCSFPTSSMTPRHGTPTCAAAYAAPAGPAGPASANACGGRATWSTDPPSRSRSRHWRASSHRLMTLTLRGRSARAAGRPGPPGRGGNGPSRDRGGGVLTS